MSVWSLEGGQSSPGSIMTPIPKITMKGSSQVPEICQVTGKL